MKQEQKISNGVKKLFISIFLMILFIPIIALGQIDISDIDIDNLLNEQMTVESEINLQSLDLYWFADTYVPFGYQGRPLPTQNSSVTVNANLKITGGDPKSLKYSWFLDDVFQEAKSGYGRDSFKFGIRRKNGAQHTVLLKVFNESRSFLTEKTITIPVVNPELVIYSRNNSPINLPYVSSEKESDVISDEESSFLALPYFFNVSSLKDLNFEWILGKESVKDSSLTANIFGLKITNKAVTGLLEETLKVSATNKIQTSQRIIKNIKLIIY